MTIDSPSEAVTLSATLKESGLPLIEITFRTEAAAESIQQVRKHHPDMFIGAGTIIRVDQALAAKKAGADFVVSPGFNPKVIAYCIKNKISIIPGVDSPTLIEAALEKGIKLVKFFPAQQSGGVEYLKAIAGPYGEIQFMPTGGITPDNLMEYLGFKKVIACGASWVAPSSLITDHNYDEIAGRIHAALALIKG